MGISAAVASWLVPSLIALAGAGAATVSSYQQTASQKHAAKVAEDTARAQAQANAEQTPTLMANAGNSEAVKKKRAQYGFEENLIANNNANNTVGGNQYWG